MGKKIDNPPAVLAERYRGPNIPMAVIRRFARNIARRFQPDRIVLFGSFAYGKPHKDSDVDLLVVMPCSDETRQALRISLDMDHPFPMDLIVRKPETIQRRLAEGDWFLREVLDKGKVLYEKVHQRMGAKSRSRRSPTLPAINGAGSSGHAPCARTAPRLILQQQHIHGLHRHAHLVADLELHVVE